MNEEEQKEVYFDIYCPICVNHEAGVFETKCEECLENKTRLHIHKPLNWEKKPVTN